MLDFPQATFIHRRLPKEAFYQHLSLSPALKSAFIAHIDKIYVEHSLSKNLLNLSADSHIKEILLLKITLKRLDFNPKILESIAKANPHKLIFLLCFEDKRQLGIYHSKLYRSAWVDKDKATLEISGFSLDEIWAHFIEQIALDSKTPQEQEGFSIDERLKINDKITTLQKQIARLESAAWKEPQPKKKFALYAKLESYKNTLKDLQNEKT